MQFSVFYLLFNFYFLQFSHVSIMYLMMSDEYELWLDKCSLQALQNERNRLKKCVGKMIDKLKTERMGYQPPPLSGRGYTKVSSEFELFMLFHVYFSCIITSFFKFGRFFIKLRKSQNHFI